MRIFARRLALIRWFIFYARFRNSRGPLRPIAMAEIPAAAFRRLACRMHPLRQRDATSRKARIQKNRGPIKILLIENRALRFYPHFFFIWGLCSPILTLLGLTMVDCFCNFRETRLGYCGHCILSILNWTRLPFMEKNEEVGPYDLRPLLHIPHHLREQRIFSIGMLNWIRLVENQFFFVIGNKASDLGHKKKLGPYLSVWLIFWVYQWELQKIYLSCIG